MIEERAVLEKTLSPLTIWAIALGTIIGFGTFILPSDLMDKSGPIGAAIGIVIGGLIMVVIAVSYGFMVKELPVSGGEFAYAYTAFGRNHAFLCGWFLTLGYLSIVPLNATALAILAKFIAPGLFEQGYLYTMAGYEVFLGEIALASIFIIIFGFFNYKGVKDVGRVQLLLVGILVGTILIIGGGTLFSSKTSFANMLPPFAMDKGAFGSILAIVAIAPWMYVGFDTIPQAAEEYDFPPEKGFKLIFWAIMFGAAMYVIMIFATAAVFPWEETVKAKYIWATGETTKEMMGTAGIVLLLTAVCMGVFTGINGFFMATSRLIFGMGRAKILPKWFGSIHATHKTPANAIIFIGLISLVAPWFGREVIVWVVDMAALGTTFGYMYTCFGAYKYGKELETISDKEKSKVKRWGIAGGLLSFSFLLLLCVPGSPGFMATPSWAALVVWAGLGVIFYLIKRKEYLAVSEAELDYLILGREKPATK